MNDVERNAQIRATLTEAFPGTAFKVRNGRGYYVHVEWTDGPLVTAVNDVLLARRQELDARWLTETQRHESAELISVKAFRARRDGRPFYEERTTRDFSPVPAGDVRDQREVYGGWIAVPDIDGATLTDEEHRFAAAAVAMAGPLPAVQAQMGSALRQGIGRVVYHFGDALEGALA